MAHCAVCHGRQIHPMADEWQAFPVPCRPRDMRGQVSTGACSPPRKACQNARHCSTGFASTSVARLVELVDTLGLGPSARAWGFESLTGHQRDIPTSTTTVAPPPPARSIRPQWTICAGCTSSIPILHCTKCSQLRYIEDMKRPVVTNQSRPRLVSRPDFRNDPSRSSTEFEAAYSSSQRCFDRIGNTPPPPGCQSTLERLPDLLPRRAFFVLRTCEKIHHACEVSLSVFARN